jgi:DNA-directed RNA polymerase II subunit RPB2
MKTIKMISEKYVNIGKNINLNDIKKDIITKDIRYAMSTGNWSVNKQNITKTGVSQVLSRLSYLAALSHLRRIVAPIAKDGKSAKPRQLHVTSFGYCCPAETPEGHACGIVKNMSLSCHISTSFHSDILESMIKDINKNTEGEYRLFFNGKLMGKTDVELAYTLREFKRTGKLNFDTGISIDNTLKEIKINTDAGRCSRPLLRVENGKLLLEKGDLEKEWKVLIDEGKIEYLDVYECENAYIAMDVEKITKKHTHAELHPSMIMSVCSGIIPYPDHNQAPRNCYQSSMCKQAMGIYSTNFDTRMDTISQVLFYPQKRLVEPKTSKYVSFTDIPAGMNAIVAIMCHTGFNGWTLSQ